MRPGYLFWFEEAFDGLFPDFILAFTFFTAVTYAVLANRFDRQRPAIAIAVALGLSLSLGLVYWEHRVGLSITDLGPIAVGFALIVLGGVMYQAIKQVGGTWAGIGLVLGGSLLVSKLIGVEWPVTPEVIQTIMIVALIMGLIAFLVPLKGPGLRPVYARAPGRDIAEVRHDMSDLYRDRQLGKRLRQGFRDLKQRTEFLPEHPTEAQEVMNTLQRMLPAEGWLTERLARLREKAHRVRKGHVARINEIQHIIRKLPLEVRKKASRELAARYEELHFDLRLERLDRAVAAYEKRIRDLTRLAESCLASHDYRRLQDALGQAEKLQTHNAQLLDTIERTEKQLLVAAEKAAKDSAA